MIKIMNLKSKTKLEHLQECKQEFRKLMPQLSILTPFEQRSFVHMIQSKSEDWLLIDDIVSRSWETKLA
jgi:hypothetical protein